MADRMDSGRATWFAIAAVLLGVLLVMAVSDRTGLTSTARDRGALFAVLSSSRHVSDALTFRGADVTALVGSCALDLRRAQLAPGQAAAVDIFAMMGSVTIRVPDGWTIDSRAIPVMGGIRDERSPHRVEDGTTSVDSLRLPRLVLRGFVMMGSILVKS